MNQFREILWLSCFNASPTHRGMLNVVEYAEPEHNQDTFTVSAYTVKSVGSNDNPGTMCEATLL